MKKLSKLSLTALAKSAESILAKDELRSLKGGNSCTGFYEHDDPNTYNPGGMGYVVNCYDSSQTFLGYACSGSCSGTDGGFSGVFNCWFAGYPTTSQASC